MIRFKRKLTRSIIKICALTVALCYLSGLLGCNKNERFFYDGFSMDSYYKLTVYADEKTSNAAAKEINDITTALEKTLSAFDGSSVVFRLNAREDVAGSDLSEIIKILKITEQVAELSDERYSAVCGAVTTLWGIGTKNQRVPTQDEAGLSASFCGSQMIEINGDGSISFLNDKALLDFGSVGKGCACDKAKAVFEEMGICSAVAAFGGSVLVFGNSGNGRWNIGIRSPFEDKNAGFLSIENTSFVSTSGGYERFFDAESKIYHHIFDLKNGMPADSGLASVTVISDNGVLSDALSTACFILGKQKSKELLNNFDNTSAVFIENDGSVYTYNAVNMFAAEKGFTLKGEL